VNKNALGHLRIINHNYLFDTHFGLFWKISETSAFIIDELKRHNPSIAALSASYAKHFKMTQGMAERDVELFLNDMMTKLRAV
jgi:hypothetical protein